MTNCKNKCCEESDLSRGVSGESLDGSNSVHIWRICLDRDESSAKRLLALLSKGERDRSSNYRFAADRNRFIVRRGMLRKILAVYLRSEPRALQFCSGECGKPYLTNLSRSLEFSVTHSQSIALIAVTRAGSVGVDLECVRPLSDLELMIDSCLSDSEKSELEVFPSASRLEYFYRYWTCKEAWLKSLGVGLDRPLTSVGISLTASGTDHEAKLQISNEKRTDVVIRSFVPLDGYMAALAVPHSSMPYQQFSI